jgi:hypothetical protein
MGEAGSGPESRLSTLFMIHLLVAGRRLKFLRDDATEHA